MAQSCFIIKIFDSDNPDLVTLLEQSQKSGVRLNWNGGEEKDTSIIGSNLNFNMLDERAEDGRFLDLYTGNETRYRVELYNVRLQDGVDTEILFWKGFLLPEQYSEPYRNGQFFVNFVASCGLGRLKGKFLPDEYYENSFTYIEFITACLSLTRNDGNLYFSPALRNKTASWDTTYINGEVFVKNNKNQDAYKILETIFEDSLCCVFHEYGNWFVMGYNKRIIKKLTYKVYDLNGVFIETKVITRKPVDCSTSALVTPQISIVAPLKEITVTHDIAEVSIPSEVFQEKSDGWVITAQSSGNYNPRNLFFNNYQPDQFGVTWVTVDVKTNKLSLFNFDDFDETQYLFLRDKIFVTAGQKLKFSSSLTINRSSIDKDTTDATLFSQGKWSNLIRIAIVITDFDGAAVDQEIVYTLSFGEDKKSIDVKDFIIAQNGFLDIRLFRPIGGVDQESILDITIDDINLEEVGFMETETFSNSINEEYSQTKEIDLTLSDDLKSSKNLLSIQNPRLQNVFLYSQEIPIRNTYVLAGKNYVVVVDFDIFPINDMNNFVFVKQSGQSSFIKINNPEVVYNINNTEQNAFTYDPVDLGFTISENDVIRVDYTDYTYPTGNRITNLNWCDDIFQANIRRYGQIVADVYRNLYKEPHLSIDISLNGLYGISTLISFPYRGLKDFYPLRIEWDLSLGKTQGFYHEAFYGQEDLGILPISVDAGEDIFLTDALTPAIFNPIVVTPNSFIVTVFWEQLSGTGLLLFGNTLNARLILASGVSKLRITITDNFGQTASDTISVFKVVNYTASLLLIREFNNNEVTNNLQLRDFEFVITPDASDKFVEIQYIITAQLKNRGSTYACLSNFTVFRNDINILFKEYNKLESGSNTITSLFPSDTFSVSIAPGDTLKFALSARSEGVVLFDGGASTLIRVQIVGVTIENNTVTIVNAFKAASTQFGTL